MNDSLNDSKALRPYVPIRLGKKDRHLLVTFRALLALEEATGASVLQGGALQKLDAKEVKVMAWGALMWDKTQELSVREIGKLIHGGNMTYVVSKLTEAWSKGLGVEDRAHEFCPLELRPEIAEAA